MIKIKIYNIYTCRSKDNKNNDSEVFKKKSLVDPLEKIPSLKEYVERYVVTGALPPFNNQEIDSCDSEEFGITDIRGADVEDLKDYRDSVLKDYENFKKSSKKGEVFTIANKDLKEDIDKSEASEVKQSEASE